MEANNTKAMREAYEFAEEFLRDYGTDWELHNKLCDRLKSALSAPPRNCDKFADAETARRAWLDDAENWDEFGSPKLELHEWLFAPATEQKGGNDGSK